LACAKIKQAFSFHLAQRAYPGLILEAGKMTKKNPGSKLHFLPKYTKLFQKMTFFPEKSVRSALPCPWFSWFLGFGLVNIN